MSTASTSGAASAKTQRAESAIAVSGSMAGLSVVVDHGHVADILLGAARSRDATSFRENVRKTSNAIQLHELISGGLPYSVVPHLLSSATRLYRDELLGAIGMSARTMQRYAKLRNHKLTEEQSDRTWRLGALLAKASELLGGREAAEEWFNTPAMALENRRPIELLSTTVGAQSVERLLGQIEYGVYV